MQPPQRLSAFPLRIRTAHIYGAAPGEASLPPAIRVANIWKKQIINNYPCAIHK